MNPRPWKGAMRWGKWARFLPTPREAIVIVVITALLLLGLAAEFVL